MNKLESASDKIDGAFNDAKSAFSEKTLRKYTYFVQINNGKIISFYQTARRSIPEDIFKFTAVRT